MRTKSFKILSLDGGGFRGIFSAHILKRIEEEYAINWTKHFDLISGTSTGSIIAAGLTTGLSAKDIFAFYENHSEKIFEKSFLKKGLLSSQYNNKYLKNVLNEVFQDKKLGDYIYPLIIPSTDIGSGKVHVFKSFFDNTFVRDKKVYIRDAVLASCSAPTFFDPHTVDKYLLSDGGLWANNPSLMCVIDAIYRLKIDLKNIKVFSLGTGISNTFYSQKETFLRKRLGWGFITKWGRKKFIEMLLNLQSETAQNMSNLLLQKNLFRINFESDQKLSLDDVSMQNDWVAKADRYFTHNSQTIKKFLEIRG